MKLKKIKRSFNKLSALTSMFALVFLMASTNVFATSTGDFPSLQSQNNLSSKLSMKQLCIYYGGPEYVNGSNGNVSKAVNQFIHCNEVVFGDGLEHTSNSEQNKTQQIINQLKSKGIEIFGYVPIGTNGYSKLSTPTIKQYIDEWNKMGVQGIFLDEFGFDYGVTRAKQNDLVDYVHNKRMHVIANAWVPRDAMDDKDQKGNNSASHLGIGDWYLMESFIVDNGKIQFMSEWSSKADYALALGSKKGIKIAAVSTISNPGGHTSSFSYKLALMTSTMYGFSAFQWSDNNYSANDNVLTVASLPQNYGTKFMQTSVIHSGFELMRQTDTGTFNVSQRNNQATFVSTPVRKVPGIK